MDENNNKIYFYTRDYSANLHTYPYNLEKGENIIVAELDGGITNTDNLIIKCSGIYYVNRGDEFITLDLTKKLIEDNNLGIRLDSMEENKFVIYIPENNVEFDNYKGYIDGKGALYVSSSVEYGEEKHYYEFDNLNFDKLVFEVLKIKNNKIDGFNIKL